MSERVIHPWPAVFDENSKVLILGTMPSPASRKFGYYGHPQNVFWPTLAKVLGQSPPESNQPARQEFLLRNRIALWDVIQSCDIEGASDASISNVVPNDFSNILATAQIEAIFTTGKTATNLFNKLCAKELGVEAKYLPSTSPANCAMWKKREFMSAWREIGVALNKNIIQP